MSYKDNWLEWWFIWVDCDVINGNARFEDGLVLWNCMVATRSIERRIICDDKKNNIEIILHLNHLPRLNKYDSLIIK